MASEHKEGGSNGTAGACIRHVLSCGIKVPSVVAHSVPARAVPDDVLAALRAPAPGAEAETSACVEWNKRRDNAVRGLMEEHMSWPKVMLPIKHRRVHTVWKEGDMCVAEVVDPEHAKATKVGLVVDTTCMLSASFRRLVAESPRHHRPQLSYKYDGENWLVRYRDNCFTFHQRSDRRPRPEVANLRRNLLKLYPPHCLSASNASDAAPSSFLATTPYTCRHCGDLTSSGQQYHAHMAHDAVVAAHTGQFAAFYRAYAQHPQVDEVDDAAAKLLVFVSKPFTGSLFDFPRAVKGGGRSKRKNKRRRRKGKGKGKGGGGGENVDTRPTVADVVEPVAQETWSLLKRCSVGASGSVIINVTDDDFEAADATAWEPCHHTPDAITLHWPGYRHVATLRRSGGGGEGVEAGAAHPFEAAKACSRMWMAATAAASKGCVPRVDGNGWELWVVVSVHRLPARGKKADTWDSMTRLRSTAVRPGVGTVPERWKPVWSFSASGIRDVHAKSSRRGKGGKGATMQAASGQQQMADGSPAAVECDATAKLAAFEVPAQEAVRYKLKSDVSSNFFGAMLAVGAASTTFRRWMKELGQVNEWQDSGEPVWEHSFELVGSGMQGNMEGLDKGVSMLVPHGWHPRHATWQQQLKQYFGGLFGDAAHDGVNDDDDDDDDDDEEDGRRLNWNYFAVVKALAEAPYTLCKEGMVMYMPLDVRVEKDCVRGHDDAGSDGHGDRLVATSVAVKFRRDHFGLPTPRKNVPETCMFTGWQ